MKTILLSLVLTSIITGLYGQKSIYNYKVEANDGTEFDFSKLKGKKIMIVNTASKCGLTPQYKKLEELYKKYGGDKFIIIAFPANNFRDQEPGSNLDIKQFCETNYGITFPLMAKISVKGNDMAPIYQWLTSKELNGKKDSEVSWNFQKYLIDENGNLFEVIPPRDSPDSEIIVNWIEGKNS